jgi:Na+-translocating ferredoxin:NAD+ oxidoreductase RnfD subunit
MYRGAQMLGTRPLAATFLLALAIIITAVLVVGRHLSEPLSSRWKQYAFHSQDMTRYRAYANATLGKPYMAFYVRSDEEWRRAFAAGEHVAKPEATIVTPARPLRPYRDFLVEYPPGFFLAALPPALVTDTERSYGVVFEIGMLFLLCGAWLCAARLARYMDAAVPLLFVAGWGTLACIGLGMYSIQRYDPLVALLVGAMCLAAVARRPVILGLAAGAAIVVKLVPAVVAGLCGLYLLRRRRRRELAIACAVMAATLLAVAAPVVYLAGGSIDRMVSYHVDRPLEIETTAGALLGLWHAVDPSAVSYVFSFGSSNVTGRFVDAASWATNAATALSVLAVFALAWRELQATDREAAQARVLAGAAVLALAAVIAFGKVSSPQYFTWVIPLGALLTLVDGRASTMALFLLAMAGPQLVLSFATTGLVRLAPWAFAAVLLRNGLLLAWAWRLRQRAWRAYIGMPSTTAAIR